MYIRFIQVQKVFMMHSDIITRHTIDFPRNHLVCEPKESKELLVIHKHPRHDILNIHAKRSLDRDNDAKRRSRDEAISIHIITDKLNTRLSILYEAEICEFYGKPDFIITLGRSLYIMVSTTRAISKKRIGNELIDIFDEKAAMRLVRKKLTGLAICSQNLECLVDDVIADHYDVRAIMHILSPNVTNANLCVQAYNQLMDTMKHKLSKIRIVISIVDTDIY
jgi:hypothetical protein